MNLLPMVVYLGWSWLAPGFCVEQAIVIRHADAQMIVVDLQRVPCSLTDYERARR